MPFVPGDVIKVLVLSTASFIIAMLGTPVLTHFLYKYKSKKNVRTDTTKTPVVAKLHAHKRGTPTMGGILVWATTLLLIVFSSASSQFNFLTRSETLLPLGVLIASALVGLVDDIFNVKKIGASGGGLHLRQRVVIFTGIAAVAAWWFVAKLEWTLVRIPFADVIDIGLWAVPLIIVVIAATANTLLNHRNSKHDQHYNQCNNKTR